MGANYSSLGHLASNDFLMKYAGSDYISDNDPFWREFLSFRQLPSSDYIMLEKIEEFGSTMLRNFQKHNVKTRNLSSLMKFIISHGTELIGSVSPADAHFHQKSIVLLQNALLVFRLSSKYLLEHTTEQHFFGHLADNSSETFGSSILETFFQVLFNLMLKIPVKDFSYALHCETIMCVLTLLARQMHREISSPLPLVYAYIMWSKCAVLAPMIVQRLLQNFTENLPTPPGTLGVPAQSSFVWRAASSLAGGLLSVITLGYASREQSTPTRKSATAGFAENPTESSSIDLLCSEYPSSSEATKDCHLLANLSSLLLLVLTSQAGSVVKGSALLEQLGLSPQAPTLNPYRIALFSIRNLNDDVSVTDLNPSEKDTSSENRETTADLRGVTSLRPPVDTANYSIDFMALRNTAALTLHQDSSTLLLYLLVYRNVHFQSFLMDKRNYNKLLLPLLNILYRSPADSSHLVYMALIIILIWTENEKFSEEIHNSTIDWVTWSPNRNLSSISRGSLIILVLLRTVRYNLNQLKDKYLHVNILAALANLSSQVRNLHPHVSDSFLRLLQLLVRRHTRTVEELHRLTTGKEKKSVPTDADGQNSSGAVPTEDSLVQELSLLEEVIRMVLEILNSILSHALPYNPNMVYSLLYGRDCLTSLRSHPSFQNVIQNIDTILTFFTNKITNDLGENPSSPTDLLSVINKYAFSINRSCNLRKIPDLKFKYVEEESPDEFFIPYVWSIVVRQSGISFRTESLPLFSPDTLPVESEYRTDAVHQTQNENTDDVKTELNHT